MKKFVISTLSALFLTILLLTGCATPKGPRTPGMGAAEGEKPLNPRATYHFISSETRLMEGDLTGAITDLEVALKYDKTSPYLLTKLATLYLRTGDTKLALETAKKALAIDSRFFDAHKLTAAIYSALNMTEQAAGAYEEIIRIKPDDEESYLFLGILYSAAGKHDRAIESLNKLLEIDPDSLMAFYYLGRVYTEKKEYPKAIETYGKSLAFKPSFQGALYETALLYEIMGEREKAVATYEQLLLYHPDDSRARSRLGNLLVKGNRLDDALDQYEAMKDSTADDVSIRLKIGLIYMEQGKFSNAIDEFELILTADPGNAMAHYYIGVAHMELGNAGPAIESFRAIPPTSELFVDAVINAVHILKQEGDKEEAVLMMEEIIASGTKEMELYFTLAALYSDQDQPEKGIDLLKRLAGETGESEVILFRLGILYDKAGRTDDAVDQMRKVIEVNPLHADAMNYLGYTFAEKGINLDEAETLAAKALSLKPEDGYITDTLGWVYFKKGEFGKAVETLKKAALLSPDDPTILEHLADAFIGEKDRKEAKVYYERALQLQTDEKEKTKLKEKLEALK